MNESLPSHLSPPLGVVSPLPPLGPWLSSCVKVAWDSCQDNTPQPIEAVNLSVDTKEAPILEGASATCDLPRPTRLPYHNTDIASRTANLVRYDDRVGLALCEKLDNSVLLGRCSTCRRVSTCHRTNPLRKISSWHYTSPTSPWIRRANEVLQRDGGVMTTQ